MTLSQRAIEAAARAIIKARQEWDDFEGPFGVYNLGYNTKEVVLGPHAVLDFRPGAKAKIVARFDTHEEAMAECAILTEQYFLTAALAVDGLLLVPVEPTESMLRAGFFANVFTNKKPCGPTCIGRITMPAGKVWTAMIAAANDGEERK